MMEVEIPLLGVLVVKDHAQQVQKKNVYCKPTHTDRYFYSLGDHYSLM